MSTPYLDEVVAFLPRLRSLASRLSARTGGAVEREELVSVGAVGLVDAASRYDRSRSIPFDAFVFARVHGAMRDELRAADLLGRRARRRQREANEAEQKLRGESAVEPTTEQIDAARNGVDRALPRRLALVSMEEAGELAAHAPTAHEQLEHA